MPSHEAAPLSQSKREAWRQAVLLRDGPTCRMPKCLMPSRRIDLRLKAPHPGSYTADHVVPLTKGGAPYDPANGRPAHWRCNITAGASIGGKQAAKARARKGKPQLRYQTRRCIDCQSTCYGERCRSCHHERKAANAAAKRPVERRCPGCGAAHSRRTELCEGCGVVAHRVYVRNAYRRRAGLPESNEPRVYRVRTSEAW